MSLITKSNGKNNNNEEEEMIVNLINNIFQYEKKNSRNK